MQPTAMLDVKREGDLGGRKVKMQFDPNSIAHIMSVLTDLYSDAEMAIIREYTTNARDSHVDAGQTRPIEVYTPSNLSPFFRVKDYGVGMDLEDIENIYSQYGASTKRKTNTQTGMLGLGCKSALTYTNQFTVVAVKNGIKTSVMVSRVEDGTGVMEVLFQKPTDEPNGVEIVIPVRFSTTFEQKVRTFFSYWEKGTVLLNDREPESIKDVGNKIGSSEIYMVKGSGLDKIVMGNVAYPVEKNNRFAAELMNYYSDANFHIVAFVNIGELAFVPSREALNYEPQITRDTLARVRKQFTAAIHDTIRDDIKNAKSHREAIDKFYEWSGMLPRIHAGEYSYQNQRLNLMYESDAANKNFHVWNRNAYRYAMDTQRGLDFKAAIAGLQVYGFPMDKKVTPTMRKKVEQYMQDNGAYQSKVYFVEKVIGDPWVAGSPRVSFDTIQAVKLPPNPNARPKRVAKYDVIDKNGYAVETDDIDDKKNIYFCSPADWKGKYGTLVSLFPDDVIVAIGRNRFDKFMRDFPGAKAIETRLKPRMAEVRDSLEAEDFMYLSLNQWSRANLSRLDYTRFDDPALKAYVKAASSRASTRTSLFEATVKMLNSLGYYGWPEMAIEKRDSPFIAYPLVGNINDAARNAEHIYAYCNAVYNKENK